MDRLFYPPNWTVHQSTTSLEPFSTLAQRVYLSGALVEDVCLSACRIFPPPQLTRGHKVIDCCVMMDNSMLCSTHTAFAVCCILFFHFLCPPKLEHCVLHAPTPILFFQLAVISCRVITQREEMLTSRVYSNSLMKLVIKIWGN